MARILSTNDPYTSYASYVGIDSVYSGTVYDVDSTSYNITLRNTPLCFFHTGLTDIGIKDNSGLFSIDLTSSSNNFVCTSIPLIGQTTELIVLNTEIANIKIAPDSVVNALYTIAPIDCDGNPTFCVHTNDVENFCAVSGYGSTETGTVIITEAEKTNQYYKTLDVPLEQREEIFGGFLKIFEGSVFIIIGIFLAIYVKKLLSSIIN